MFLYGSPRHSTMWLINSNVTAHKLQGYGSQTARLRLTDSKDMAHKQQGYGSQTARLWPTNCKVMAQIGYEMGHHAHLLLPTEVWVLKFRTADLCASTGKSIEIRGSYMSLEACESSNLIHSVPLPSVGIAGAVAKATSYLIDILLFR
jgi:hypothetical protein